MSDRWRCFIAIPIGDRLRADLARAVAAWQHDAAFAGLRWTDPATWHVTLAFLGATEPGQIVSIVQAMRTSVATVRPVSLATGGFGAFPSPGRVRVLWYGIADPEGVLAGLSAALHEALGMEAPERFSPHLTLARARRDALRLRDVLGGMSAPAGTLAVEEIRLMRSHLEGGPARHETIDSVPLGASVHV